MHGARPSRSMRFETGGPHSWTSTQGLLPAVSDSTHHLPPASLLPVAVLDADFARTSIRSQPVTSSSLLSATKIKKTPRTRPSQQQPLHHHSTRRADKMYRSPSQYSTRSNTGVTGGSAAAAAARAMSRSSSTSTNLAASAAGAALKRSMSSASVSVAQQRPGSAASGLQRQGSTYSAYTTTGAGTYAPVAGRPQSVASQQMGTALRPTGSRRIAAAAAGNATNPAQIPRHAYQQQPQQQVAALPLTTTSNARQQMYGGAPITNVQRPSSSSGVAPQVQQRLLKSAQSPPVMSSASSTYSLESISEAPHPSSHITPASKRQSLPVPVKSALKPSSEVSSVVSDASDIGDAQSRRARKARVSFSDDVSETPSQPQSQSTWARVTQEQQVARGPEQVPGGTALAQVMSRAQEGHGYDLPDAIPVGGAPQITTTAPTPRIEQGPYITTTSATASGAVSRSGSGSPSAVPEDVIASASVVSGSGLPQIKEILTPSEEVTRELGDAVDAHALISSELADAKYDEGMESDATGESIYSDAEENLPAFSGLDGVLNQIPEEGASRRQPAATMEYVPPPPVQYSHGKWSGGGYGSEDEESEFDETASVSSFRRRVPPTNSSATGFRTTMRSASGGVEQVESPRIEGMVSHPQPVRGGAGAGYVGSEGGAGAYNYAPSIDSTTPARFGGGRYAASIDEAGVTYRPGRIFGSEAGSEYGDDSGLGNSFHAAGPGEGGVVEWGLKRQDSDSSFKRVKEDEGERMVGMSQRNLRSPPIEVQQQPQRMRMSMRDAPRGGEERRGMRTSMRESGAGSGGAAPRSASRASERSHQMAAPSLRDAPVTPKRSSMAERSLRSGGGAQRTMPRSQSYIEPQRTGGSVATGVSGLQRESSFKRNKSKDKAMSLRSFNPRPETQAPLPPAPSTGRTTLVDRDSRVSGSEGYGGVQGTGRPRKESFSAKWMKHSGLAQMKASKSSRNLDSYSAGVHDRSFSDGAAGEFGGRRQAQAPGSRVPVQRPGMGERRVSVSTKTGKPKKFQVLRRLFRIKD
ncbi:hypothetical protein G7K_6479-t1 [Saitoella complicata NRRL Y-17804]|uniref:Uncharacterized protein n=2 Tax=Saitoella complicata (strain BCRC 22490 / CBS 7301 / JCM 7358 / NBRC 10748 / NRRL Y-17804) TaxID=698492 RepID=A0A0E9NRV6_SAICN|nr:hypothetical protein G7K_6479-t1 [Saitoella complicata NRRL Y-17804]